MSECEAIVEAACRLPGAVRQRNQSPRDYATRAGLAAGRACLRRAGVRRYLRQHPYFIEHWLDWSADKRTGRSWYFSKRGPLYVVGYYPGWYAWPYFSGANACAAFVIREVKGIIGRD